MNVDFGHLPILSRHYPFRNFAPRASSIVLQNGC
jgi:hypothetical protein